MYTLDTEAAKKSDQGSKYISEIGKYVGKFIIAESVVAKKGTKGVKLTFASGDQTANISIYTHKADGTAIYGFNLLMAIMTCLKVKVVNESQGNITEYDYDQKKDVTRPASVYLDLMNKDIGLLLETEEWEKEDGSVGVKMTIAMPFEAATDFTASEILSKSTTPSMLQSRVEKLKHRPLKQSAKKAGAPQSNGGKLADDFDDDIPF